MTKRQRFIQSILRASREEAVILPWQQRRDVQPEAVTRPAVHDALEARA